MPDDPKTFMSGAWVGATLVVLLAFAFTYGCEKPTRRDALRVLSAAGDTTGVRALSNFWSDK